MGLLRLLLVLSLIVPTAVFAFVTLQSRALLLDNATNRTTRMAELLAQQAAATFDGYNAAFSRIEEHLLHTEGQFQEKLLHEYLSTIDRDMRSVDGITIVDADGAAIAHSRYFPVPKTYVGDREYIQNATAANRDRPGLLQGRDGLVIGLPVRSRISGKTVLLTSRGRHDIPGATHGALVIAISQQYFEEFYRTLALNQSDRVALIRADTRVLAQIPPIPGRPSIDPEQTGALGPITTAAASEAGIRHLADGTIDYVSPLDGARRISGFRKVDGYPVYVEVGFAVDNVLAPWRSQVLINLIIAAIATLLLFSVARMALVKSRDEAAMQALLLAEEHQRVEAESALRQAQKMEALGQLTGGIAHDFNNLLNVVLVNLELATKRLTGRRPEDIERVDGYVKSASQGAERGVALTRRLLAFAHRQEDEAPVVVPVSDLVVGVLDLLGQAVGSKIRITLDAPRGLRPVRVDPTELETALLNLVVNARDAMAGGGRVHISVREEGNTIVLSVKDTGRGMDAEMLKRATEPFFTTKESGKGSGLGLSLVERFATQAGGSLRLDSHVGTGTTAEIRLPVAA
ncbi:ATP-binding protein [Methylobacterium gnaphalii]|uniref:histidine kinase n=1 Tax=Methylobacterium gnaphalii TaxID=1010610 RepID=A0A512JI53_9HYPH|nr:ATP-binding protein [Methylobacterium gnaphalii]GEP09641.1 hypothetical protein MGN01_14860 [Methylobacterium gnaphalii]GJD67771.1 Sensor histidine kinase RcsC [Methylobacterium gnaphalii]GLS50060.1 hypothetical protein GCM10007885_29120 [Methylobacterium gnaphalii]